MVLQYKWYVVSTITIRSVITMEYLGKFTICPNVTDIEVECFGTVYPSQRETLEQEGFNSYVEVEKFEHNGVDITDYLSDNDIDKLTAKCNEK